MPPEGIISVYSSLFVVLWSVNGLQNMKNKQRQLKNAFTITELLVAIGLLAALLAGSGIIFQKAVQAERIAKATSQITRKLQVITEQIDRDFSALRKDGEIVIVWVPGIDIDGDELVDVYERLDRIMFYTTGDFTTYHAQDTTTPDVSKYITGNLARVCYTFARNAANENPKLQSPSDRILLRTQHIYTSDSELAQWPELPFSSTEPQEQNFQIDYFKYEYDNRTMAQWNAIEYGETTPAPPTLPAPGGKSRMLSIITGTRIRKTTRDPSDMGTVVDTETPSGVHLIFCEGVGQFSIQGWSDTARRWVPMLDPDDDGDYTNDTDFYLNGNLINTDSIPGVQYPYREFIGSASMGAAALGVTSELAGYPNAAVNEANFNNIPGLGRALKFTFTLYDSRGIFKDGKTFSHIVYLDR